MNLQRVLHSTRLSTLTRLALLGAGLSGAAFAAQIGADVPWTTYEAEAMQTNGTVLGPTYVPYVVTTEASAEKCVKLAAGQHVEFKAAAKANAVVIRYSLPDTPKGGGLDSTLELLVNGKPVRSVPVTSRFSYIYGDYPFSNDPGQGKIRNFFDEARVSGLTIAAGDVVRVQNSGKDVPCIVDLVDLEDVAPALSAPANSLSLLDFGVDPKGNGDATDALRACIAEAQKQGKAVWVPPGQYKLTGDVNVPSGVTIQGAGMWHTTFVGDEKLYEQADRRIRFKLNGDGMRLADFAILGRLAYRNDSQPNDSILGEKSSHATIARIWIEHTKTGIWIYNGTDLHVEGCRFRDTLADGINLCAGSSGCLVENCAARGTGDDCFAIWPADFNPLTPGPTRPGHNVIRHCTGELPFLANGGAIYGGESNRIEDCRFVDITPGCGILISTTFPTSDNFSGQTVVEHCEIARCGGFDHDWAYRGSVQICIDRHSISGLVFRDVAITDNFSDGLTIIAPGRAKGEGTLSDTVFDHVTVGRVGFEHPSHGLWIKKDVAGGVTLKAPQIADIHNDSADFKVQTERE
jgi:hypothetical protein